MNTDTLEKINRFTRRPFTEEEVYTFDIILCDNDIDRDCERFSDEALEQLREKFIGRTGIFDHDPSTANQTARIFDAEVTEDSSRSSRAGIPYKCLKASAYMIRTGENSDLIAEIDGGIKKEVSISCSAAKKTCSVCGCDRSAGGCSHVKGRKYGGRLCHTILSDITDAYEWSFVAVPAQINAGVTKRYGESCTVTVPVETAVQEADEELRRDIRRLAYFTAGRASARAVGVTCCSMGTSQLIELKKSLESRLVRGGVTLQLSTEAAEPETNSEFSMK